MYCCTRVKSLPRNYKGFVTIGGNSFGSAHPFQFLPSGVGLRNTIKGICNTSSSSSRSYQDRASVVVMSSSSTDGDRVAREYESLQAYQATVEKLSAPDMARTIVQNSMFGVLSTNSRGALSGYPSGSVAEYACDASGHPIFCLSSLGSHKGDLLEDPKCSLTILKTGFQGMQDARVNIVGSAVEVGPDAAEHARAIYLEKHPNSFWVDFGDFSWFILNSIENVRLVGGFGMAGSVSPDAYQSASPDPIAQFSAPVCGHMNADHGGSSVAMVKHYAGISVDKADMISLDRYGIDMKCVKDGEVFNCRLGFPTLVQDRRQIKEVIVTMTKEAAAAKDE